MNLLAAILSYGGLLVFLVAIAVDVGFLLWDAHLLSSHQLTISHQIWNDPVLAIGVIGWQAIGFIGLVIHLLISPYTK